MSADSIMRVRALFLVASAAGFGSHPLCTCSAELAELETLRATMAAKDSEVAEKDAIIAELQATVASMTSPPPLPPPSAPLPAPPSPPPAPPRDEPCHTAFDLATLAEAEAWCATNCDGRTVKVTGPGEDVDYSTETGGVCAIYVDVAGENDPHVTLTNYDDCFVITSTEYPVGTPYFERLGFGKWKESSLLALAGNDVLCGSGGDEYFFYGGDGDDLLAGGPGDDSFHYGGAGDDKLFGGHGNEYSYYGVWLHLYGGEGEDSIYGEENDDAIVN